MVSFHLPLVEISKNVDRLMETPLGWMPGPETDTFDASPACPSTLTSYGLFGISRPENFIRTLCVPSICGMYDTEYVKFLSLLKRTSAFSATPLGPMIVTSTTPDSSSRYM